MARVSSMRAENLPCKSKSQGRLRLDRQSRANKPSSPHLAGLGRGVWGEGRLCSGPQGESPGAVSLGSCSESLRMGTCYSELNESQGISGGQEIEEVA